MSWSGGAGLGGAGLVAAALLAATTLLGCSSLTEVDGGLVAIEVTYPSVIEVGQTLQLSARPLNADGDSIAAPIVWRTPDTTVTVDSATGLVTGITAGPARVQAASGTLASSLVTLTVVTPTGP